MNVDHAVIAADSLCRRAVPLLIALGLGIPYPAGAQGPDLLEPEKAFRIATRALDARNIEVHFRIADGYYLYRDRFRFETGGGRLLADAEFPKGQIREDAFFGRTETYRREVRIRVPVAARDAARGSVRLKVTSQGCADVGVCYVPLEQFIEVRLDARSSSPPAATLLPAPSPAGNLPGLLHKDPTAIPDGGAR